MNKFTIVLVRPRDPNNIGAAARAMANFGLSELRVVEPYLPTWQIAVSAVGAQDILQNATCQFGAQAFACIPNSYFFIECGYF